LCNLCNCNILFSVLSWLYNEYQKSRSLRLCYGHLILIWY